MAKQLIESLSADFDPEQYRDEYREELLALIERKAEGEEIVAAATEEPKPTKAPDLMAALEESLAAVKGEQRRRREGDGARRRRQAQGEGAEAEVRVEAPASKSSKTSKSSAIAKQGQSREVEVDGRELKLTNLDKVPLPEGRVHQGRGDRLLRAGRAGDRSPTSAAGR